MITTLTPENLRSELIEASQLKTVAVYFYADALAECQGIGGQLEQFIGADNPQLNLLRADMADPQMQGLAMQMGLQALPALVLFQQGRPVDALMGPEQFATLQDWLAPYLPKEEDLLLTQARQALADNASAHALTLLQQARQLQPQRADINKLYADVCIQLNRLSEARQVLETILMVDQDGDYQRLMASLQLAEQASQSPELVALEQKLAQEPDNVQLRQDLAIQYSQAGRQQEALDLLLPVLRLDLNAGDAKKTYLDILATMDGDPAASRYRRQLYSLMY